MRSPAILDVRQSRDAVEIDEYGGTGHPEIQQRQQALTAGQHLPFTVRGDERFDGGLHCRRRDVVESGQASSVRFQKPISSSNLNAAKPRQPFSANARRPSLKSSLSEAWSMSRCTAAGSSAPAPIESPFSMYFAPEIDNGALAASRCRKFSAASPPRRAARRSIPSTRPSRPGSDPPNRGSASRSKLPSGPVGAARYRRP